MHTDRRDVLRQLTAVAAGAVAAGSRSLAATQSTAPAIPATGQAATPGDTLRFFPGFRPFRVTTSGASINGVIGGEGPPLLLLHGAPQTHISWRLVAPALAARYTVVVSDLRGYGDSSKPPDGDDHVNYSKRAMALDQVEVMQHFGFDRFPVVGHDRGGRVAHRMALDHPERVTKIGVVDIVPAHYLYTHVTLDFVQAYYHWFSFLRRPPVPENELQAQYDAQAARATSEVQTEYLRAMRNPETIHAMCEDYRASASIDLRHDAADRARRVTVPLLTLWGERGAMGRLYDVLAIWRDYGTTVSGRGLPGGHNLQEDSPDLVRADLEAFLSA